jgi:hypothetical protein
MADEKLTLVLLYEPASSQRRPVPLARTTDPDLLLEVAAVAIAEAEQRAENLATEDAVLGEIEREEAERLSRLLRLLFPRLSEVSPSKAPVSIM